MIDDERPLRWTTLTERAERRNERGRRQAEAPKRVLAYGLAFFLRLNWLVLRLCRRLKRVLRREGG